MYAWLSRAGIHPGKLFALYYFILVCDFLTGCVSKGTAVTGAAGGLIVLGAPHDSDVTEIIKGNLIDIKIDVRIFDSTFAQY